MLQSQIKKRMRYLKSRRTNAILNRDEKLIEHIELELDTCRIALGTKEDRDYIASEVGNRDESLNYLYSRTFEQIVEVTKNFSRGDYAVAGDLGVKIETFRTYKKWAVEQWGDKCYFDIPDIPNKKKVQVQSVSIETPIIQQLSLYFPEEAM